MIPAYEFYNTSKKIGKDTIYRVSVRQYLVFMDILTRIQNTKDKSVIRALQLEIVKLASDVRRVKIKHISLYLEIVQFNIPVQITPAKNTKKGSVIDVYKNVLILMEEIVSSIPSVSIPQVQNEWNIFQVMIMHDLITRRKAIEYTELTQIQGLAKYKPQVLFDRYKGMIDPSKPLSTDISLTEAFKYAEKYEREVKKNAEFH